MFTGEIEKDPTHRQHKLMTFRPFSDSPSNEGKLTNFRRDSESGVFSMLSVIPLNIALAVCRFVLVLGGVVVDGPLKLEGDKLWL